MWNNLKTIVCNLSMVAAGVLCVLLFAAAVEGGLPLGSALLYGFCSVCGCDLLCRVLLPAPGRAARTGSAAGAAVPASPAGRVSLRVVKGGRAA